MSGSEFGVIEMDYLNGTDENATYYNASICSIPSNQQLDSSYFHAAIYSMYSIVFVISIFGNGMVCYIVVSSPRMRTVTNYFIMNLAVGDILITILCIPFTAVSYLLQYWPFDSALCPIVNYSQGVSVFVSAYTLVAISVDRYIAIMWPLRPRLSKSTSGIIILLVWAIATLTVLPIAVTSRVLQPDDQWFILCERYVCREEWSDIGEMYSAMYTKALLILQYVIPLSVLLFTYTSIAVMIWCHRIPGEAENCRDQRIAKSKRKMVKMMITVVVVYTICWLPLNLVWVFYDADSEIDPTVMSYVFFSSHWFAMSHTCYNPIIYCYMNARFRSGFVQTLASFPCTRRFCAFVVAQQHNTSFPLTSIAGTDNTTLHRNNTSTTYISTRLKNARLSVSANNQAPIRSASMLRNGANQEMVRRVAYPKSILEQEI